MNPIRRLLPLSLLALCTACGSIPTKSFDFVVIDNAENPRPCLIVVNDDWIGAAERNQFVNVANNDPVRVEIAFPVSEVEVTAAPVLVESGKITRVPKSRKEAVDYSGFLDDQKKLRVTDHPRQLFILRRKGGSS
jgi:mRNA-degrading endonuclease toxin of MazEF toxin-antitoxin module